jgi:hypothetical protein
MISCSEMTLEDIIMGLEKKGKQWFKCLDAEEVKD